MQPLLPPEPHPQPRPILRFSKGWYAWLRFEPSKASGLGKADKVESEEKEEERSRSPAQDLPLPRPGEGLDIDQPPEIDGTANAFAGGAWQSDGSRHALDGRMKGVDTSRGTMVFHASNENRPVMQVAYFFSGVKRKASIGEFLKKLCIKFDVGLEMHEVDILVGGSEHDLMDKDMQTQWIARIESGEFDFAVFTPPCGSWSRANWANDAGEHQRKQK